jgi:hypothetical protein
MEMPSSHCIAGRQNDLTVIATCSNYTHTHTPIAMDAIRSMLTNVSPHLSSLLSHLLSTVPLFHTPLGTPQPSFVSPIFHFTQSSPT